jgi:hypothetical protein
LHGKASIAGVLRVALSFLRPWHNKIFGSGTLFFGMAGSHNDNNVLQCSLVFAKLAEGNALVFNYEINGHPYKKFYYLADGIYPDWSTFVKTIREPTEEKKRRFVKRHEACRKDVEHAFIVLQSGWAIVCHPARTWSTEVMWEVMNACVIMHNMIAKDERDEGVHDQG